MCMNAYVKTLPFFARQDMVKMKPTDEMEIQQIDKNLHLQSNFRVF